MSYTAHFGDLKPKKNGDLVGDFTKQLVTRMNCAPTMQVFKLKLFFFGRTHFSLLPSGPAKTSSFVWNPILLLRPFHKVLISEDVLVLLSKI